MLSNLYKQLNQIQTQKPQLFSPYHIDMDSQQMHVMKQASTLIQNIMKKNDFIKEVMPNRPEISRFQPGNFSAMIGFDFHITETTPKLIEINTNAGGLITSALWSHRSHPHQAKKVCAALLTMFQQEFHDWQCHSKSTLKHIAIVDQDPFSEFTIDDFLLTKKIFEAAALQVTICRTDQLHIQNGKLYANATVVPVDLVYNRSCDFYFNEQHSQILKQAYLNRLACITPNPYGYALISDKFSLSTLYQYSQSNPCGLSLGDQQLLQSILLPTYALADDFDEFTRYKRRWFFKPVNAHAGIGAFRGDKVSRKKLAELNPDEYIVQEIAKPAIIETPSGAYKYDVRIFSHKEQYIDTSVRVYQGRITNFRSNNGGYASISINDMNPTTQNLSTAS